MSIHYINENGFRVKKTSLEAARTDPDAAGKLIEVDSSLDSTKSNIGDPVTGGTWPTDRSLIVHPTGRIGNSTAFNFADGVMFYSSIGPIFTGAGAVAGLGEVNLEGFGFSPSASAATNRSAWLKALAVGAKFIACRTPGTYALDNATAIEVSQSNLAIKLAKMVLIQPNTATSTVFSITGKNVTWNGGAFEGDGTHNNTGSSIGRPISMIEAYNGATPTSRQKVSIKNVSVTEPFNAAINVYRSVDVKIKGLDAYSVYGLTGTFVDHLMGIYIYSSAMTSVNGCTINGMSTGMIVGGSPTYTFNDFSGVSSSFNTRGTKILGCTFINQADHGVYVSNQAEDTIVQGCTVETGAALAGSGIKFFGSGVIDGCTIRSSTLGISCRTPYDLTISNNKVTVTGTGDTVDVVVLEGYEGDIYSTAFNRDMYNISIIGNIFTANNPTGIRHGIYAYTQTQAYDGVTQNLIKNMTISGNSFAGYIGARNVADYNSVINLWNVLHVTPASSLFGENITITNNNAKLEPNGSAEYNCKYFAFLSGDGSHAGFDGVNITGNTVSGIVDAFFIGNVKNGMISGNTVVPHTGNAALVEVTNAYTPASNNYFGKKQGGSFAVLLRSETSKIDQEDFTYYNSGLGTNITYECYTPFRNMIITPSGAARAITLAVGDPAANLVFAIGTMVTVYNKSGTYTLTFELSPGGSTSTIAINSSKTFYCTGSNTFVEM